MKLNLIPLIALIGLLAACTDPKTPNRLKNAEVNTDTLKYTYKTIRQRAADCGTKSDSSCTAAVVKYPVFEQQPALNDTVSYHLANLFATSYKASYSTVQQAAEGLIAQYDRDKKGRSIPAQMHYSLDSHAEIITDDTALVTIELSGYYWQGGAHGITITKYINWDTRAKKNLRLDDILISGYAPKLNAIAEQIFRAEELLTPTATLANDYFFKNARFSLNNNFALTPLGIKFMYNPNEIKPYAAGQTSLEIPYQKISKLIKPGSVAATYIH